MIFELPCSEKMPSAIKVGAYEYAHKTFQRLLKGSERVSASSPFLQLVGFVLSGETGDVVAGILDRCFCFDS